MLALLPGRASLGWAAVGGAEGRLAPVLPDPHVTPHHAPRDGIMDSVERAIYLATSSDITRAAADMQAWTAERSVQLGMAVSTMLKASPRSHSLLLALAGPSQAVDWCFRTGLHNNSRQDHGAASFICH